MMKKVEIDQLLKHKYISGVRYSPDGQTAAFTVTYSSDDQLSYKNELWIYEGGAVRFLMPLTCGSTYWWEDVQHILIPALYDQKDRERKANNDQFTTFYRVDIASGTYERAFSVPFSAKKLCRYKENQWLITGSIDARCPDLYNMTGAEREHLLAALTEESLHYQIVDELPFYYNGEGMVNKKRTALFLFDSVTHSCRRLTGQYFNVSDFAVVGESIFYSGKEYTVKKPAKENLFLLDPIDSEAERVTPDYQYYLSSMCSLDGKLVFLANENSSYWGAADFYTIDAENRRMELLAKNEFRTRSTLFGDTMFRSEQVLYGAGSAVYYMATDRNASCIFRLDMDGKRYKVTQKEGAVTSFSISESTGEILMSAMFDWKLAELYRKPNVFGETDSISQVTSFNEPTLQDTFISIPEKLSVQTCGLDIDGWITKPINYDPKQKYPAILEIHGGPLTAFGELFSHELQMLAGAGYFVFYCNPAGSDGRGDEFADIRGRFGEIDYEQIMDFTDAVLARYPQIDKSRVCVTGGSYAGFMTNWIIGHTDRFACAVSQRSISNWISFYGDTDIGTIYAPEHQAANPFDSADRLWDHSPMKYVANIKTPTLFLHSFDDGCAPLSEAMQMYSAMADLGIDTRLFIFKNENHDLSRTGMPKHRIKRLEEMLAWFDKYAALPDNGHAGERA